MPTLKIKHRDKTEEYELKAKAQLTIGRSKLCDIVLPYKHISRQHCTVILMVADTDFYWVLKDGLLTLNRDQKVESTNGTYLNNEPVINLIPLHNNDVITFSQSEIYPNIVFVNYVADEDLEDENEDKGTDINEYVNDLGE